MRWLPLVRAWNCCWRKVIVLWSQAYLGYWILIWFLDVLAGLRGITDILGQHGLAISSKDSSLFLARISSNNKAICSAVPLDKFIQEEELSFAATSDTERGSASISSSCNATESRSVGSGKRRLLPTDVLSDSDSEFEPEYKPMKFIKKKKVSAPAAPSPAPAPLVAQQLLTIKKSKGRCKSFLLLCTCSITKALKMIFSKNSCQGLACQYHVLEKRVQEKTASLRQGF